MVLLCLWQPFSDWSYGASISFHISYHPHVSSAMCWRPPGIPLLGPLKSPLCLIGAYCQRNIWVFSFSSSPFWQDYSAPAVLASPELMQMYVWSKAWLVSFLSMTRHINGSASGGINDTHCKLPRRLTMVRHNLWSLNVSCYYCTYCVLIKFEQGPVSRVAWHLVLIV